MSALFTKSDLLKVLKTRANALGLGVHDDGGDGLAGELESIKSKWFLGGRKVVYRMSCRLAEAEHVVRFREAVVEKSWGLPPPTLTVETTTIKGWDLSGTRKDVSTGGSGSIDYARVRETLQAAVTAAGWQFDFEGGRMP